MTGKQVDLFLDQLVDAPIKDEQRLMEFPFFSLQKRPREEQFVYDDGRVKIEINPGAKGIATIWDKDILIYLASLLNERLESGQPVNRTIAFPAYDFLKVTGRGTGKRAYELFLDSLFRLRSTTITTTIESGGHKERRGFGWIETWRVVERTNANGEKVMAAVEVTLNDWMFRSIVQDRRVLTINREYFRLTQGLQRRLYELARKHVGRQPEWWISLDRLYEKCGVRDTTRKFKYRLSKIIEGPGIPDYNIELLEKGTDRVPFNVKPNTVMVRFSNPAPEIGQGTQEFHDSAVPVVPNQPLKASGDARHEAHLRFPDYNIDYLHERWLTWSRKKNLEVKAPDRAFLSFCETYVRKNPLPD